MTLSVGAMAPDFTLKNSKMEEVTLSKLRGKPVLLLFMPLAFTGVCSKECAIMTGHMGDLTKYGHAFGITVDSPFTLAKWSAAENYQIPLLSDLGKETIKAYDVHNPSLNGLLGVAHRAAFLLDKDGKIAKMQVMPKASDMPDLDGFIAEMKKLA